MACCMSRLRCGRAWDSSLSRDTGIRAPESILNLIEGRNPEHREGLLASLILVQAMPQLGKLCRGSRDRLAQLFPASGLRARGRSANSQHCLG